MKFLLLILILLWSSNLKFNIILYYTVHIFSIFIIMKEITSQQQRVLDCIQIYIKKTGFPPTRADICRELGFKSPNSAETHLRALEKKGFISIESGASRGISVINGESPNDSNEYPIIGLVAAGSPTLAQENIEKTISCPESFFDSNFDYFLKVKGLSMKDAGIMEDDLIAVKKTTDVRNGDIVIARIDDEVTVKYFNRKNSKVVELEPANEDFENIVVDLEHEQLHIEGKSVGLLRKN